MSGKPPEQVTPDGDKRRPDRRRVSDPEEYNQQARLQAINQARQRVEDTIEQSMIRLLTDEDFTEADRQQAIRAAMFSYLTNIEWLMAEAGATELLDTQHLGDVVLDPPEEMETLVADSHQGYPRVIGTPSLKPYSEPINGVQAYLTAPEAFEKTWTLSVETRHNGPTTKRETRQSYMPVHISLNAFRVANRFLKEAGIDIEFESGKPHGEV